MDLQNEGFEEPADDLNNTQESPTKRKKRDEHGIRIRKPTRKQKCQRNFQGEIPKIGKLADCWAPNDGCWTCDTCNSNSWESLVNNILGRSKADIMLTQESKIHSAEKRTSASRVAKILGWTASLGLAFRTTSDKGSGGCGVLVRKGTGLCKSTHEIKPSIQHRIHHAWVGGITKGGVHCISVYLRDGENASEGNLEILAEVAILIKSLKGPWIVAGDFNMTPATLATTNWHKLIGGRILAPEAPTCLSQTYDYFVVKAGFAQAVEKVQVLDDGGLFPHSPSRLYIRSDARRHAVRKLTRPTKIPGRLPHGPASRPPSYKAVNDACTAEDCQTAVYQWYTIARQEWAGLTGCEDAYKPPKFSWQPAAGECASKETGTTNPATAWRILGRRADEVAACLAKKTETNSARTREIVGKQTRASRKAVKSLSEKLQQELQPNMDRWCSGLDKAVTACSVRWAKSLAQAARKKATASEETAAKIRTQGWRDWLGASDSERKGLCPPSRGAYRWVKGLAGWAPSRTGHHTHNDAIPDEEDHSTWDDLEGYVEPEDSEPGQGHQEDFGSNTPLCDQAALEQEGGEWAELWDEGAEYNAMIEDELVEELEALTVPELKQAALSFPADTGLGADNISPRALARLSDEALASLIRILHLAEKQGKWPKELDLVMIVLLPKPDGGSRPIGLFPTLIRVWMRARSKQARKWEADNDNEALYGGAGMGAQKAAWITAFNAESACLGGQQHAQALFDLVKAFEKIPHDLIIKAAKKKGYPLAALRLSLAAYRLTRTIGSDGNYSRKIVAARGITAGSGFATSELRLLLLDLVIEIQERWPNKEGNRVKLYVDDLTITVSGGAAEVGRRIAEISDFVTSYFQDTLRLEVSKKKSVVTASRHKLARYIANRTKTRSVRPVKQAKMLGTAAAAGARRSVRVQNARLKAFRTVADRIAALRKMGVNTTTMARGCGTQGVTYGNETQGISNSGLHATRVVVNKAAAAGAGGKNVDLSLYALDGAHGTLDPAFLGNGAVVYYWALALWENWVPASDLKKALAAAEQKLQGRGNSAWGQVNGPSTAMIATLQRIGWTAVSHTKLIDDEETEFDLTLDPPSVVKAALDRSTRRWRLQRIDQHLPVAYRMSRGGYPRVRDEGVIQLI